MLIRPLPFLLLALIAACPTAPPLEDLEDIDGLGGGELTSDLTVPTLTASTVAADEVTAGVATLGDIAAQGIDVTGSVAAETVRAGSVETASLSVRGYAVFGAPIGTATFSELDEGRGYLAVDDLCRADFGAAAHVCSADEALTAYRAGLEPADVFNGAAVISGGFYTSLRLFSGDEAQDTYFVIDDCDAWTNTNTFNAGFTIAAGELPASYRVAHTYLALVKEVSGAWRLAPTFTITNCSEVTLACCG